jgi:hypothetical protein
MTQPSYVALIGHGLVTRSRAKGARRVEWLEPPVRQVHHAVKRHALRNHQLAHRDLYATATGRKASRTVESVADVPVGL